MVQGGLRDEDGQQASGVAVAACDEVSYPPVPSPPPPSPGAERAELVSESLLEEIRCLYERGGVSSESGSALGGSLLEERHSLAQHQGESRVCRVYHIGRADNRYQHFPPPPLHFPRIPTPGNSILEYFSAHSMHMAIIYPS